MLKRIMVLGIIMVFGIFFGFIDHGYAQKKGLVGYWKFDEGEGDITRDSSSNIGSAIIEGAAWQEGKFGKALLFDGEDDYVDCGNDSSLDITGDLTIEFWMKTSEGGGWHGLVTNTRQSARTGYSIYIAGSHLWCSYGNKGYHFYCSIDDNIWYHIAMVVNKEEETMSVYIDGKKMPVYAEPIYGVRLKDSKTIDITEVSNEGSAKPLLIGYGKYGADCYFNGIIDEVAIYNDALSDIEVNCRREKNNVSCYDCLKTRFDEIAESYSQYKHEIEDASKKPDLQKEAISLKEIWSLAEMLSKKKENEISTKELRFVLKKAKNSNLLKRSKVLKAKISLESLF